MVKSRFVMSPTARPRSRIQQKNREVILDAALEVFSLHGFRGATLDQIAEVAGLSKPNLLYYFPSKEEVHKALLTGLLDTWLDPLRAMSASGEPLTEIMAYVRRKLDLARDYPRESRLFANEILQGAPRMREAIEGDLRRLVAEKAQVLTRWMEDGRIAAVDPVPRSGQCWVRTTTPLPRRAGFSRRSSRGFCHPIPKVLGSLLLQNRASRGKVRCGGVCALGAQNGYDHVDKGTCAGG
jgi:TetR/AcrR family transcriptional regulator